LKSMEIRQISMKKFLNDFMGSNDSNIQSKLIERQAIFIKTMKFIHKNIGVHAFQNISAKENDKYVMRFHPTIFDAVACATLLALPKLDSINITNLEKKRLKLLKNEQFGEFISIRTTDLAHIRGRIALALRYLYSLDYE